MTAVEARDWKGVEDAFRRSAPFNYVVLDTFLKPDACEDLRRKLLDHWGWRYKNWVSKHLHNDRPKIPEVFEVAEHIQASCPHILGDLEFMSHWALMYHKNTPGNVHSDLALVVLTLWLTPEKYNQEPSTGGFFLYDVKRDADMLPHEHLVVPYAEDYVKQHTKGETTYISYGYNRAVLFDACTFHRSAPMHFSDESSEGYRINLSFAFDSRERRERFMKAYETPE